MIKANPLFVDSTVLAGENIRVEIQLEGVLLYDYEEAFILVETENKKLKRPLRVEDEDHLHTYSVRFFLQHQQEINYTFTIERDGIVLFSSSSKRGRASYLISQSWMPCLEI